MTTFENTPLVFEDKDYEFFEKEFGLDREAIDALSDDGLNELYDKCCDIEIDETGNAGNNPLSERGEMAVRLVDLIHGPYDSTEYDAAMAADD